MSSVVLLVALVACQHGDRRAGASTGGDDAAEAGVSAVEEEVDAVAPASADDSANDAGGEGATREAPRAADAALDAGAIGPLRSDVQRLPFRVIEAAYSRALDRMIIAAGDPARLIVLEPDSGRFSEIALPRVPHVLSVRPDGLGAAVGFDHLLAIVDLKTQAITQSVPLDVPVRDLILADNGYVYFVPGTGQWVSLRSLKLATGELTSDDALVWGDAQLALHPSGRALYVTENGGFGILPYDLTEGPARARPRASRERYPSCPTLWFGDDGARLFCASLAYQVAEDPTAEFRGATPLTNPTVAGQPQSLPDVSRLLVVPSSDSDTNALTLVDAVSWTVALAVPAPRFRLPAAVHDTHPRGAFFNAKKTRIHVLLEADADTPLIDDTALMRLDVGASAVADPPASIDAAVSAPPQLLTAKLPLSLLDARVIDADYSRSLDRVVAVADQPPRLLLIDPTNSQIESVSLSAGAPPTSVNVQPDGRSAAITTGTTLTLVDLERRSVITSLASPAYDAVLAGNGHVYAFTTDTGIGIQSVELSTGQVTPLGTSLHALDPALHVSGDRIYAAGAGSTPSDIYRYDLQQGVAVYAYQSSISYIENGRLMGFDSCRKMWLSDEGRRLFSACSQVLRTSNVPRADLTRAGRLEPYARIEALAHSSKANLIAIAEPEIGLPGPAKLSFYEAEFLRKVGEALLPSFKLADLDQRLSTRFLFFRSDGTELYALGDRPAESGPAKSGLARLTR